MSIFKDSFHQSIREQLNTRQVAINNRTPQNLTYYNSRNAWIRMSSSVNTYKGTGNINDQSSYTNELAKKYILQGGLLNNGNARAGLGDFSNAYSNIGADGSSYRLGIRPMPGITSVEVKSLGAYGSLREATVNFQCWDIKQLEDLELLYMRPGYSLLLEWGWSPYLSNGTNGNNYKDSQLITVVDYEDIINNPKTKEELFARQYARSTDGKYKKNNQEVSITGYQGNVDSMYGLVKNYSWKARMDGGYDCTTTIISLGEVIESLKVNYAPLDNISSISSNGLIYPNVGGGRLPATLKDSYTKNIIAGICDELWNLGKASEKENDIQKGYTVNLFDNKHQVEYDMFVKKININGGGEQKATSTGQVGKSDVQVYIQLEGFLNILNNYVLLRDKQANKPFTSISVRERNATSFNLKTGEGYLLALAHPLELSVDLTACIIKSPVWLNNIKFAPPVVTDSSTNPNIGAPVTTSNLDIDIAFWKKLVELIKDADGEVFDSSPKTQKLIKFVKDKIGTEEQAIKNAKEFQRQFLTIKFKYKNNPNYDLIVKKTTGRAGDTITRISDYISFYRLLDEGIIDVNNAINATGTLKDQIIEAASSIKEAEEIASSSSENLTSDIAEEQKALKEANENIANNIENLKFLKKLKYGYFTKDDWKEELGIIANIYLNVNMLYNLSLNEELEAQDTKEKKDIALYDYIKNILSRVSSAIGEVNNFDIFVDPDDNIARIIDINYVDKDPTNTYENAFELQIHNLNSIVRSYGLESKIFPNQSTIVAIGAQAGGSALGIDTTTLVNFNKSIIDRIIPIKDAPTSPDPNSEILSKLKILNIALGNISRFLAGLEYSRALGINLADSDFNLDASSDYRTSLKDLINYYKAITASKTNYKAIIPTKLSVTMDGVGGIVIGNIFRINEDILPKGYKSNIDGTGVKIGYTVTGIGHSLQNNDWVTNIDAQVITFDDPKGADAGFASITIPIQEESGEITTIVTNPVTGEKADAMRLAGNTLFNKKGEAKGLCAKGTYAIARGYTIALNGGIPDGYFGVNGSGGEGSGWKTKTPGYVGVGNANDASYRNNLAKLGYKMTYLGLLSKQQLKNQINQINTIGTIINYRSAVKVEEESNAYLYGHTQIYTGGVLSNSKGSNWASSFGNNYGNSFIYNSISSNTWETYLFTLS